MTRSKEEQVEAASREYAISASFQNVARKLLDGYYAEEPLPKIVKPGKGWAVMCFPGGPTLDGKGTVWMVQAMSDGTGFTAFQGPARSTVRDAILAWNAGMERP